MIRTALLGLLGALAFGGFLLAAPFEAAASEALPSATARGLDKAPAEFAMTAAKQRRLMIMRNATRQERYGRGGYGRGYGPGPRHGYGRGYGPRPGYGPRRGYGYRRY